MPQVKPKLEPDDVLRLLEGHFGKAVTRFAQIDAGSIAQTFSFDVDDQGFVVRFQAPNIPIHYEKEMFIYDHYASPLIPIAPIVHIGEYQGIAYGISRRLPGKPHKKLSPPEYRQALPSVVATLYAIHQADVSRQTGYGVFNGQGVGGWHSWRAFLSSVRDEEPEWDFYGKWHALFETTCLERALFDRVYARMSSWLDYCPEDRYLVHGGYGFDNLLIQDGTVTGVLDWIDARFGDFVYDVAWLDYWMQSTQYQELYERYSGERGLAIPHMQERLFCCKCYIGMDALKFNAKTGNAAGYKWNRDYIVSLLS